MAGDVFLWTLEYLEVFGITLSVDLFGFLYGEFPCFTHADLCVNDEGDLITSIQNKGVSSATVEKRKGQFIRGVQLRNTALSENTIDIVCDTAYTLEGDYDSGGYDGQIIDFLFRIPWTPRGYLFTSICEDPELYYCSEFVVECFLSGNAMEKVRIHPAPNDIYNVVGSTDWEIVGTWELEK